MSSAELSKFLTRALDDEHLRQTLSSNPQEAFKGFNLTDQEKQAVTSHDENSLRQAGIDPMTARSWMAFHDVATFAPDEPDLPGDLRPE